MLSSARGRRCRRRPASLVLAIAAAALLIAPAAASARPDDDAVLSPLGMSIESPPHPVLGADGRQHLAYEISIVNQSNGAATLGRVQPRTGGHAFGAPTIGADFDRMLRVNGGGARTIPAGGSAMLFMDVTYGAKRPAPRRLLHAFDIRFEPPGGGVQHIAFVGVPTKVGREAIAIGPPLEGPRWVAANGCCDQPLGSHRGATLSIDGTIHVPERFAIDFVQLNRGLTLFDGPIDRNESYGYFGARLLSVAAGRVVRVQDGLPDLTPGALPPNPTVQSAGGNFVVVRIAKGQYAFYAHLKPGSLRVEVGDRVRRGQVLGLLGNSGNTDGPHLHFHVMDSPSPLQANGLPYVFDRFTGVGRIDDISTLQSGAVQTINRAELAGRMRNRMPLANQVVNFR
jgi:hypothetical protein